MRKFIFEEKMLDNLQNYLDKDPHPCYRLVSVSIFGMTQHFAGITWEVDDSKILKQSTGRCKKENYED